MGYSMDMSQESAKKKLLPEGWRDFEIIKCKEETSKAGNVMFHFTLIDIDTKQEDDVYAIATPKKRWFLKQILATCGIEASKDGIYEWEISNVLHKIVAFKLIHQEEEWINRDGNQVITKKHKFAEVRPLEI